MDDSWPLAAIVYRLSPAYLEFLTHLLFDKINRLCYFITYDADIFSQYT